MGLILQVKVSGGTQTPGELKSCSVGGTSGAQLSASVRERLLQGSQSLPKPRSDTGSLSDSNSPYSALYRHTTAYTASLPARTTAGPYLHYPHQNYNTVGLMDRFSKSLPFQSRQILLISLAQTLSYGARSENCFMLV